MRSAASVDSNGQPTAAPASNDLRAGNFALTIHSTGAIPEPATWGLMIVGFASVGAALRSRRRLAA